MRGRAWDGSRFEAVATLISRRKVSPLRVGLVATFLLMVASPSKADDDDAKPPVDRSAYSLLNPTPANLLRPFTPDRPCKVDNPYTVDPGHFLIEGDFASYESVRLGSSTKVGQLETLDPIIRLGVLPNVDVGIEFGGLDSVRQAFSGTPRRTRVLNGFGEVTFSARINIVGDDGGDFALAAIPHLTVPSSTPASLVLGDDNAEGGLAIVAQLDLPYGFELNLHSEIETEDVELKPRIEGDVQNLISVSRDIPGLAGVEFTAEFYSSFSRNGLTPQIYTADFGLGYRIAADTQIDVETDFGLNPASPKYKIYFGMSRRL